MKIKYIQYFIYLLCLWVLSACASSQNLSQAPNTSNLDNSDPLNIGLYPTPPVENQAFPKLVVGKIHSAENERIDTTMNCNMNEEMLNRQNGLNSTNKTPEGDFFALMSPGGAVLTIWALAQGNWLWGYTLIDSACFGEARVWNFRIFEDNEVMIENLKTRTCVSAYGNGLIHTACNEKSSGQKFKLIAMSNESFMIKNKATNKCIQAPIGNVFGDFHKVTSIFLSNCAAAANLDQQWYIIPPPLAVGQLYKRDKE